MKLQLSPKLTLKDTSLILLKPQKLLHKEVSLLKLKEQQPLEDKQLIKGCLSQAIPMYPLQFPIFFQMEIMLSTPMSQLHMGLKLSHCLLLMTMIALSQK
jgi:uncharacterized membrane protein YadS